MYSQNFEFKYVYEVCDDSKLIEEHLYDSKTGIYKEINYDRNTFIDTTNNDRETFEAYIPLGITQKKNICTLLKSSNLKDNTFISGSLEKSDYIKYSIFFYENGILINDNNKYLDRKSKRENFEALLSSVLDFIHSSEEYNRVFYWYGEKK
jgi:hypothetical protein